MTSGSRLRGRVGIRSLLEQLRVVQGGDAGSFYDLERLLDEIVRDYFPAAGRPRIHWGRKIARRKRRSIRLGSYYRPTSTIRIHPLLDTPAVPRFFIQSIVYHEMLHHVLGPAHDRRFHRQERGFHYHREAREWLRRNLGMLLGLRERPDRRRSPVPAILSAPRPQQLSLFS
jgi:predicted metal-dependent hydrolase